MSNGERNSSNGIKIVRPKKSIRNRIVISFASILAITILLGEIFLVVFLNNYYYGGVEQLLTEKASSAAEFLNKYAEYTGVEGKSSFLFKTYLGESDKKFLVQTLDKEGRVLMDSLGGQLNQIVETGDVKAALQNRIFISTNIDPTTRERTMSASRPLLRYSSIDGVVRYTVSLTKIDEAVRQYYATSFSVAFLLILLLIFISAVLSHSIVYPIEKLILVAREMAKGNFDISAEPVYEDEVGELSNTLNMMVGEIKRNDQLKKDFISSISHELRTPLTSIKGWGETLLDDEIQEGSSLEIGLKIITNEADRLSGMVEELLDFSRLESHKMKVSKKPLSLNDIATSVYRQMQPRAKGGSFRLTHRGEEQLMYGDENRLRQILINLITNSIKFSQPPLEITLTVESVDHNIKLIVQDNGVGISSENLRRVREKFFKEDMNSPGSGIGLALVDEIVKLHGGIMEIESTKDIGTKITITFPAIQN